MSHAVKVSLLWSMPPMIIQDLVTYAVSRINMRRATAISQNYMVCVEVEHHYVRTHLEFSKSRF